MHMYFTFFYFISHFSVSFVGKFCSISQTANATATGVFHIFLFLSVSVVGYANCLLAKRRGKSKEMDKEKKEENFSTNDTEKCGCYLTVKSLYITVLIMMANNSTMTAITTAATTCKPKRIVGILSMACKIIGSASNKEQTFSLRTWRNSNNNNNSSNNCTNNNGKSNTK